MTFDTAFERSHPPNTIATPPQMDWQQVELNGGPPCFFVEGPQFCGRAERWQGHGNRAFHDYVSLDDLLTTTRKEARVAALRGAANTVYAMSRIDARDKSVDFLDGAAWMQDKAAKLIESTIEAAANDEEGEGDG